MIFVLQLTCFNHIRLYTQVPQSAPQAVSISTSPNLSMLTDITKAAWLEIELYPYNTVVFGPIWYEIQRLSGLRLKFLVKEVNVLRH